MAKGCACAVAAAGALASHDGTIVAYSTVPLAATPEWALTGTEAGGAQQQSLRQVQVVLEPCDGASWCAALLCAPLPPAFISGMPVICATSPP